MYETCAQLHVHLIVLVHVLREALVLIFVRCVGIALLALLIGTPSVVCIRIKRRKSGKGRKDSVE